MRCTACDEPDSAHNRLKAENVLIGGLLTKTKYFCVNEDACEARRFRPSRSYTAAHAAVLAGRKERLS